MAAYSLSHHFAGESLLSDFSFYTGADRSNGFVNYLDHDVALAHGLVSVQNETGVRIGVDSTSMLTMSDTGRPSVMLTSKDSFTHGLFIADFAHMPASACGIWPSFWAFNSNSTEWPEGGEIGLVEGANTAVRNLYSAHTTDGCVLPESGFLGEQGPGQCDSTEGHIGCNYAAPGKDPTSYGDAFNAAGGGVYALEWDESFLKVWHFDRAAIPFDIQVGTPEPSGWGVPHALFGGSGCDADTYFYNMSLVLNVNFCGNYAGNLWGEDKTCSQLAATCEEYVAAHPEAYTEAYWDIRYIDVYRQEVQLANNASRPLGVAGASGFISAADNVQNARIQDAQKVPDPITTTTTSTIAVTRTVTLSTVGTPTATLLGPKVIGKSVLFGCYNSPSNYNTFNQTATSPNMTNDRCAKICKKSGQQYSGVQDDTCYCANDLGDASALTMSNCTTPCPGDSSQFCGGPATNTGARFNGTNTLGLFTIYGNLVKEPAPPNAPGKGRGKDDTVVITKITYTDICSNNEGALCHYGYYATLRADGCPVAGPSSNGTSSGGAPCTASPGGLFANQTGAAEPTVPMSVVTQTCQACGPRNESTVTLTIPEAVAATQSDVTVTLLQTVVPVPVGPGAPAPAGAAPTGPVTPKPTIALGMAGMSVSRAGYESVAVFVTLWTGILGALVFL